MHSPRPSPRASRRQAAIGGSAQRLSLPETARLELARIARATYPHEACGLLVGERTASERRVHAVTESANLEPDRPGERFLLDPVHHLETDDAARARGLEIVGVWHSHPDALARPSPADRSGAWARWSYLIVAVERGDPVDLRSWRLHGEIFVEEEIVTPNRA